MEIVSISPQLAKHLTDRELFDRISEDGADFESFIPPPTNTYLGIIKDYSIIGYFVVSHSTSSTLDIHFNILKKNREHSEEAGRYFFDYIFKTYSAIHKLNCKIPVIYEDVYNYAKKVGLSDEGVDRKSYMKGGELVDRNLLGLTREDLS